MSSGTRMATIVGHLGKPSETKQVGDQTVVEFSVATTRKVKGEDKTLWFRCSYWNKPALAVAPYLTKGQQVFVVGDLDQREYTTKDGRHGADLEIRVDKLQLCGGKREEAPKQDQHVDDPF